MKGERRFTSEDGFVIDTYRRWYQAFRWNGNWFILEDIPPLIQERTPPPPEEDELPTLPEYEPKRPEELPTLPEYEEFPPDQPQPND